MGIMKAELICLFWNSVSVKKTGSLKHFIRHNLGQPLKVTCFSNLQTVLHNQENGQHIEAQHGQDCLKMKQFQ